MKYRKPDTLPVEFAFAGFTWPRYTANIPNGPESMRKRANLRQCCGPSYRKPTPNNRNGWGFYLGSNDLFELREECRTESYGFNEFGDAMQGIVYRLPKGRGFLAGYTMGEHMASGLDAHIWDDLDDAIRAANDEAHRMAELGQHAGSITWSANLEHVRDEWKPLQPEHMADFRAFVASMGAWSADEMGAWSADEWQALCLQWIAGDVRECGIDKPGVDWQAVRKLQEDGQCPSSIYRDAAGRVWWECAQ